MSSVFRDDIEHIVTSTEVSWNEMKNAVVFVTGATGLIGTALVHALSTASERHGMNLQVIAHGRNVAKGEVLSREHGVEFICGDICKPLPISLITDRVDYIFHCAAITKSSDMVARPVDVIATAIDGTRNILELAREMRSRSVVYLSSMEVYGQSSLTEVTELDLGSLDLSNPRSGYPESKRLCESLCAGYRQQYGIPVKIARLAQTFGAGSPKDDTRIFAQFANSVIMGTDIVLHTEGKSRGNYCYTADVVRALLLLLLKGEDGQTYNVANPSASVTIREMAEIVANVVSGGKTSVIVNIPQDIDRLGYAPDSVYRLNVSKIKKLGWKPKYGLVDMYRRMLSDWGGK